MSLLFGDWYGGAVLTSCAVIVRRLRVLARWERLHEQRRRQRPIRRECWDQGRLNLFAEKEVRLCGRKRTLPAGLDCQSSAHASLHAILFGLCEHCSGTPPSLNACLYAGPMRKQNVEMCLAVDGYHLIVTPSYRSAQNFFC